MHNSLHKWLRGHFIPGEHNNDHPHFLRTATVQALMFGLFGVQALFLIYTHLILPSSASLSAIFASVLIEQTNAERVKFEVPSLARSPLLEQSAQLKADDMATRGYFSHYTPEGAAPWKFIREAGYAYRTAGENLAVNFIDSRDVTDAWMNSPTHRANLLAGKYTEVGIATARGQYKGRDAIFVVQHFGTPLSTTSFAPGIISKNVTNTNGAVAQAQAGQVAGIATGSPVAKKLDQTTKVLGISTERKPSVMASLLTQPRKLSEIVQFSIAFLALLALILAFFIRIRIQHPIILANGVMLVMVSSALLVINVLISRGAI